MLLVVVGGSSIISEFVASSLILPVLLPHPPLLFFRSFAVSTLSWLYILFFSFFPFLCQSSAVRCLLSLSSLLPFKMQVLFIFLASFLPVVFVCAGILPSLQFVSFRVNIVCPDLFLGAC